MMGAFWAWATEHWFLGFLLLYALMTCTTRCLMVGLRGWPKECEACKLRQKGKAA